MYEPMPLTRHIIHPRVSFAMPAASAMLAASMAGGVAPLGARCDVVARTDVGDQAACKVVVRRLTTATNG